MSVWIPRILLAVVAVLTLWLGATALPSLRATHLGGGALLQHMVASGGLVVVLPVYGVLALGRQLDRLRSGRLERAGFWALIGTGFVTIGTVFLCMLPIASTEMMDHLVRWHGYVGFVMVAALLLLLLGLLARRRGSNG